MLLLEQMAVLFIFILLGYICGKLKVLPDASAKSISWIVVNIANPALILSASMSEDKMLQGEQLLKAFGIAILVFVFLIIISTFLPILLRVQKNDVGVFRVMTIFSNIGFMGFPVVSAAYGETALMYASLFLFPYSILIYTYGIMAMRKKTAEHERIQWKKIFNVGVIACILSVCLYISDVSMPTVIKTTVMDLSKLTAPLSMIVIGQSMTHFKLGKLFADLRLMIFSVIKLILIPIVGILLLKLMISDAMILGVCLIMMATPVGSMTAMLAQQYDGNYEMASRGVALTTLLSVITIPLVSFILQM